MLAATIADYYEEASYDSEVNAEPGFQSGPVGGGEFWVCSLY